jgi:hypothetical protein
MAHEIAKMWRSEFNGTVDSSFDLRNLHDDGKNVRDCKHGGNSISGAVDKVVISTSPDIHCYLVQINEVTANSLLLFQYRGVAIFNPATNEFSKIVGVRRQKDLGLARQGLLDALGQEEGTWTGTQP